MKIRAVKDYYDGELNKAVKTGDEYTVTAERGEYISAHGYATIINKEECTTPWETELNAGETLLI